MPMRWQREDKGTWPAVSMLCSESMLGKCQKQASDRIFLPLKTVSFLEPLLCWTGLYQFYSLEQRHSQRGFVHVTQSWYCSVSPILSDFVPVLCHQIVLYYLGEVRGFTDLARGALMPFALAVSQPGQSRPPPVCHLPRAHRAAATGDSNGTCSFKWGKDTDLHELNSHATAVSIFIAESNAVVYCRKISSLPHVHHTGEPRAAVTLHEQTMSSGNSFNNSPFQKGQSPLLMGEGGKNPKNPMPCLRYNFSPDDKSKFYPFLILFGQNTLLSS